MRYKTPGAFRTALEQRLNGQSGNYPGGLVRLRKMVSMQAWRVAAKETLKKYGLVRYSRPQGVQRDSRLLIAM